MSEEEAFIRVICERPDDDAARLVYADWLDDRGHSARARYIRWRILGWSALGIWGTTGDLLFDLGCLQDEALAAFCDWAGPELARYFSDKSRYDRGLLGSVVVGSPRHGMWSPSHLTEHVERLFQLAPIRAVSLCGGTPQVIRELLHRSEMARVEKLYLGFGCWGDDAERVVDALTSTPHLARLRKLEVHSTVDEGEWSEDEPADRLSDALWERLEERFASQLA